MNILIIIISVLVTILSIRLFKMACGSMSPLKLNTVSYVFYFQIVTSGLVASVLLAIGALDYHRDVSFLSEEVKVYAWLWTMYATLMMPLMMIALNRFMNIKSDEVFNKYLKADIEIEGSIRNNQIAIFLMACFSLLILIYVLASTTRIPLFTLIFEGDSEQASVDRITSRRAFEGITYVKNLGGMILMPIIAYYSYIMMRKLKSSYFFLFFVINFLLAALMVSHDIQKAPIAFFILGFAILEVFISKGISAKSFFMFIVLPVLLLLIGYALTTGKSFGSQILNYNSAFYGRTFIVGYFSFPLSLELFPHTITESTYGVGIPSFIIEHLDLNAVESARLLKEYVHPVSIAEGKGNLYSGFYMAEAWANYGYLGLIIAPAIVGVIIQSLHLFVITHRKNPWILAFYAGLTVKWLVGAGFVNFFYLKLILWPLILFAATNFVLKLILKSKK